VLRRAAWQPSLKQRATPWRAVCRGSGLRVLQVSRISRQERDSCFLLPRLG